MGVGCWENPSSALNLGWASSALGAVITALAAVGSACSATYTGVGSVLLATHTHTRRSCDTGQLCLAGLSDNEPRWNAEILLCTLGFTMHMEFVVPQLSTVSESVICRDRLGNPVLETLNRCLSLCKRGDAPLCYQA